MGAPKGPLGTIWSPKGAQALASELNVVPKFQLELLKLNLGGPRGALGTTWGHMGPLGTPALASERGLGGLRLSGIGA